MLSHSIIHPEFSPDSKFLCVRYDEECLVYSTENAKLNKTFKIGDNVNKMMFSPSGNFLAIGEKNVMNVYNFNTN